MEETVRRTDRRADGRITALIDVLLYRLLNGLILSLFKIIYNTKMRKKVCGKFSFCRVELCHGQKLKTDEDGLGKKNRQR